MTDSAVTYLFSDVEGSTRLWETEPERIGPALARHDRLAREAVARHGGRIVKMTGDGLHAAFDDPCAALAAAVDIQLDVSFPPEGELPLALRCGLHLGVDQRRDGDFFGPAVNRAARVMSAAHGGQVLLTQAVAERARERLPAGAALRDLGLARLRDLTSAEQLFQLVHPRLRSEFPALRSLASTPNNLPQQLNSFVGRARELDAVRAMLGSPTVRLLTLLGMGGLGKSRLSLQAGAEVMDDYPDGVWFVELAPLSDPRSVPQAVATVLGVKEQAGGAVLDALMAYLRDKTLLLVLDNCEHLVQACAELARQILQSAPRVKVLASSRDALQTAGETVFHVPPLAAPQADALATPAALAQIDAVRLFVDRATAAQPAFRVTDGNAAAVAAICRRLDGIPLALELAAARTRALSVEAIAARLDDRFKLLVSGDRTVLPRQRTLRALIDWSYDLLSPQERMLFARLSVFTGGWTLEGAEAVGAGGVIDVADVIDLLASLVEKSLVIADIEFGRYRMLDTVRHYAAERLAGSDEDTATRARHASFFADFADQVRPQLVGADQAAWLARTDVERDDLLAALDWAGRHGADDRLALRLFQALRLYCFQRGLLALALRLAEELLARPSMQHRDERRFRVLFAAGQLGYFMGRHIESSRHLAESLAIARETDNAAGVAGVLQPLGMAHLGSGDFASARQCLDEALERARALDNPRELLAALNARAMLFRVEGDLGTAGPLYAEALALGRHLADEDSVAIVLLNLSMLAISMDDRPRAVSMLGEVLAIAERTGAIPTAVSALDVCAGLASRRGEFERAARYLGAVELQSSSTGISRDRADQSFIDPLASAARDALGERDFGAAIAAGRAAGFEACLAEARSWISADLVAEAKAC